MTDIDLSAWLTKAEAAARIGVSTKHIERLAQAGKLEQRRRPQVRGPQVAVYFPDDVERLASARQPAAAPFVLPAVPTSHGNGNGNGSPAPATSALAPIQLGADPDPLRAFAAAVYAAVMSQTSQTVPVPTRYVTVREAAAILGLPQADVRRLCHDGDLNHRLTGRGGVRIRRTDLDQV